MIYPAQSNGPALYSSKTNRDVQVQVIDAKDYWAKSAKRLGLNEGGKDHHRMLASYKETLPSILSAFVQPETNKISLWRNSSIIFIHYYFIGPIFDFRPRIHV